MQKEITILHANDIHGQLNFTANQELNIEGGISLLSGYVKKVRSERETFFGICGDVFQEDTHGSDYRGIKTLKMVNHIRPDAFSLGNHELDYGLEHLLIFGNCLRSEILCANIFVTSIGESLFRPCKVFEVGGVRMLVIGLIPEVFLKGIFSDPFCRSAFEYRDSYEMIREEIKTHHDVDLVVLMSHYGIEGDRILAENMPEDLHVDLILGGHSHIEMDKAEVVNGIPVAQSSYGTTHIGRFDLTVDTTHGGIRKWKWRRVPLTEKNSRFDPEIENLADSMVFQKPDEIAQEKICEFAKVYRQKDRLHESDLGNIIADAFASIYPVDFVILQSGSIRREECGPVVTEKDFKELYPFDDRYLIVELTGAELRRAFEYLFSLKEDGSVMNGTFQYSKDFSLVVDAKDCWKKGARIESLSFRGEAIRGNKRYHIGMTENCVKNCYKYFSLNPEKCRLVSLSTFHDLTTYFLLQKGKIEAPEKGRFILKNFRRH